MCPPETAEALPESCIAFGSATDPVAVVALLKELGVKEELAIGIEAESLFNDGTALVFFPGFTDGRREPGRQKCASSKDLVDTVRRRDAAGRYGQKA